MLYPQFYCFDSMDKGQGGMSYNLCLPLVGLPFLVPKPLQPFFPWSPTESNSKTPVSDLEALIALVPRLIHAFFSAMSKQFDQLMAHSKSSC